MQITQEDQLSQDLDWFCVDEEGALGHFTSAGFKNLPASVVLSAEDRAFVTSYFETESPIIGTSTLDSDLSTEIKDPSPAYLRSFAAMANKGLFSFDIESYLKPEIYYFRVAIPSVQLHVQDLPKDIREIVEHTKLRGRNLHNTSRISYQETLAW